MKAASGSKKAFKREAITNKTTNKGKPKLSFWFLKIHAENITKGTIQIVLATFNVAATSTEFSPIAAAAPTTDAVSWIAKATQAPNCFSLNSKKSYASGKINTATAFKINTIVSAAVTSFGWAFITGATDAIAVPPQMAVPDAIKKENLFDNAAYRYPKKYIKFLKEYNEDQISRGFSEFVLTNKTFNVNEYLQSLISGYEVSNSYQIEDWKEGIKLIEKYYETIDPEFNKFYSAFVNLYVGPAYRFSKEFDNLKLACLPPWCPSSSAQIIK